MSETRFTFQGGGDGFTILTAYMGDTDCCIPIPNSQLRDLGESLMDLADAQDALQEFVERDGITLEQMMKRPD